MHKHAKTCWGTEIVSKAPEMKNELTINEVCKKKPCKSEPSGWNNYCLEKKGKGNVSFSIKQHTYVETVTILLLTFPHSFSLYILCMLLPHAYHFLLTFFFSSIDLFSFHLLLHSIMCSRLTNHRLTYALALLLLACLLICSLLT